MKITSVNQQWDQLYVGVNFVNSEDSKCKFIFFPLGKRLISSFFVLTS